MPKITMPGGSRPEWYDRSPLPIIRSFHGSETFITNTLRQIYTVPVNRAFRLGGGFISFYVTNAGTPTLPGIIAFTLNSTTILSNFMYRLIGYEVAIGDYQQLVVASGLILEAGDTIRGLVQIEDVGVTYYMQMSLLGTEYDA